MTREFPEFEGSLMPVTRTVGTREPQTWNNWTLAFSKIRAVCKNCNETWMSDLEVPVKVLFAKMVRGQQVRLSEVDQLDLATWATLKAYVYDSAAAFPSAVTRAECESLKAQKQPPGNVRVFLAAYDRGNQFMVHRVYAVGPKGDESHGHTVHCTTFVLGHVVIRVLGSQRSHYRPFEFVGVADDRSQTVYPPVIGGRVWPPDYLINDASLNEFAKARDVIDAQKIVEVGDPDDPRLLPPAP
jgi:hypothetical protein